PQARNRLLQPLASCRLEGGFEHGDGIAPNDPAGCLVVEATCRPRRNEVCAANARQSERLVGRIEAPRGGSRCLDLRRRYATAEGGVGEVDDQRTLPGRSCNERRIPDV